MVIKSVVMTVWLSVARIVSEIAKLVLVNVLQGLKIVEGLASLNVAKIN